MTVLLIALILSASLLYGAFAGVLLDRVLKLIATLLPAKEMLKAIGTVIGWFVGATGLFVGVFGFVDFSDWAIPEAVGKSTAILGYIAGLGIGYLTVTFLLFRRKDSLVAELSGALLNIEIEVILLNSRYNLTTKQVAGKLGITEARVNEILFDALKKLKRRYQTDTAVVDLLRNRPL